MSNVGIPEGNSIDLNRIEQKYIVQKQYYIEVKAEIKKHMELYFPQPNTVYTLNRSIYFDSPDFTFLKQHLAGLDDRRKIRIRAYAPNGKWSDEVFLECKYKQQGDSRKNRLRIGPNAFKALTQSSKPELPIDDELFQYNTDIPHDDVVTQAKLLNYIFIMNQLRPVVDIIYKRYAYQDGEDLRVTIDQNISPLALLTPSVNVIQDIKNQGLWDKFHDLGTKYTNHDDFIMEVKHIDKKPDWIKSIIDQLNLEDVAFSKYVWSMYQIIEGILKTHG
jgi:SPX domain protein involved in polyphosphate accumulation